MATRTHLARRGATYVWRCTLPTPLGGSRGDFRLSTQSHFLGEAARRARRLDVAIDAVVEALRSMLADGLTLSLEEVNAIGPACTTARWRLHAAARKHWDQIETGGRIRIGMLGRIDQHQHPGRRREPKWPRRTCAWQIGGCR